MRNILRVNRCACWSTCARPWTRRFRAPGRSPQHAPPSHLQKERVERGSSEKAMNNRATVLILSSDPAFSRELTESWPRGMEAPEFVLLDEGLCNDLQRDTYDLAIAEAVTAEKHSNLKEMLLAAGKPAIVIRSHPTANLGNPSGRIVDLPRDSKSWAAAAVLIGREILCRLQAESRALESERLRAAAHAEATLGRYMIEMYSSVNNAL